ncbi:Oidioi.mRNA.OKI2018_I69.chr1.g3185.t1.cds [Oikopleura dioica]|uniref:Oidioi.mRNA.OKI2018_I69.chr1.g3185.t1.cds n=1 Tax=Oikopleura dioica TaxID=34765 RepID=A0ABN7SXQ7_OIKDI|nr:Oidioi.mRNA.OKI2018_I69.chr1.g3185.t1.cds [Oikopleura dioica]
MSHRSGIEVSEDIKNEMTNARQGHLRVLQIVIENECLKAGACLKPKKTWQEDFDSQLAPLTESNPCFYAFYRLDSQSSLGYEFILFSYISENAPVRDKMIYASTLSTVKQAFGGGYISREYTINSPSDLTWKGHQEQMKLDEEDGPLTEAEKIKAEIKLLETSSVTTKKETVAGLTFPVTSEAVAALKEFAAGKVDYVRLAIDVKQEHICLEQTDQFAGSTTMFSGAVSTTSPNYHLFKFKYEHNGKSHKKDCFVYSIPSEVTVPIKEKMLYASCKASFVSALGNFGIPVENLLSIEIDGPSEVSQQALISHLHPQTEVKKAFSKPAGPASRRPRTKRN